MKKDKNSRPCYNFNDGRGVCDEIFDPDENLFSDNEGQSVSCCHPYKFKSQKTQKNAKKIVLTRFSEKMPLNLSVKP